MNKKTPVKGHSNLKRDNRSGAVLNTNRAGLRSAKLLKQSILHSIHSREDMERLNKDLIAEKGKNTKLNNRVKALEKAVEKLLNEKEQE